MGVIPSAASDLLFMRMLTKKVGSSGKTRPRNDNLRVFPRTLKPESGTAEGMDEHWRKRARSAGNYFRRDRLEISPETETNTSTASAPIMQKAIIIFSGSAELRDGIGKPHASHACELSLVFAIRDGLARGSSCKQMVKNVDWMTLRRVSRKAADSHRAIEGDAEKRFSHFVELAKDPATKPDLGAGDMGSVNLVDGNMSEVDRHRGHPGHRRPRG